ncbi:ornithine aminotransferase [Cystobasidiomycetes sp. EMM_F5]
MPTIRAGEHGSTYGGNPLACATAIAALDVLVDEHLSERAARVGATFAKDLETLKLVGADLHGKGGWISNIRAKGLFCAIDMDPSRKSRKGRSAWDLCLLMASKGVLAKPTHVHTIRLAPPLVISEEDLRRVVEVIRESLLELDEVENIPSEEYKGSHGKAFAAL